MQQHAARAFLESEIDLFKYRYGMHLCPFVFLKQ